MADLKKAGVVAVSDDGGGIGDALLMRRIMEYASMLDVPLMIHAEDASLSLNGIMHEGAMSTQLGLKGISDLSEYTMISRDIELARLTGARVHFQHISCKESVDLIRQAKKDGLPVTAEVTPHHFTLTDASLASYDTNFKMNPPLCEEEDRAALLAGLADGTFDCIATDHAPHHAVEKERDMTNAPFGCIGVETSLGLALTHLVAKNIISLEQLVSLMNVNPAKLINQPDFGALAKGNEANLTLVDRQHGWTVDVNVFKSLARNCPFHGWELTGRAIATICKGKVFHNG